jgi:hypothetical protein
VLTARPRAAEVDADVVASIFQMDASCDAAVGTPGTRGENGE